MTRREVRIEASQCHARDCPSIMLDKERGEDVCLVCGEWYCNAHGVTLVAVKGRELPGGAWNPAVQGTSTYLRLCLADAAAHEQLWTAMERAGMLPGNARILVRQWNTPPTPTPRAAPRSLRAPPPATGPAEPPAPAEPGPTLDLAPEERSP